MVETHEFSPRIASSFALTVVSTSPTVGSVNYVAGRNEEEPRSALSEKRTVKLELLGRRFTVRSDDDDEYIQSRVGFVNDKLTEIREATGRIDADSIALLAALDIADALFRERREAKNLRRQVKERSQRLLESIERVSGLVGSEIEPELAVARAGAKERSADQK